MLIYNLERWRARHGFEAILGAGGHCVLLSEDTQGYLHSHPLEMGGSRFGPSITFHAHFSRPGIYKYGASSSIKASR